MNIYLNVQVTLREALTLLSLCQKARLDDHDRRPEVASSEDKIAEAIKDVGGPRPGLGGGAAPRK